MMFIALVTHSLIVCGRNISKTKQEMSKPQNNLHMILKVLSNEQRTFCSHTVFKTRSSGELSVAGG
jgi:hypothetical protein